MHANVTLTDRDGSSRWDVAAATDVVDGAEVDIGAFEYQGTDTEGDALIGT